MKSLKVSNKDFTGQDVSGKRISGMHYYDCIFNYCNLRGIVFFSKATECTFVGADLTGSDLSLGFFRYCDFTGANLTGCHLSKSIDTSGAIRNIPDVERFFGKIDGMNDEMIRYYSDNSIPNLIKCARAINPHSDQKMISELNIKPFKYKVPPRSFQGVLEDGRLIPDFGDLIKILEFYGLSNEIDNIKNLHR